MFVDFDGTLAAIAAEPDDVQPVEGAAALLADLADNYAVVAVLSGRPVEFLQRHVPPSVALSGLYGLETIDRGRRHEHPDAARWRAVVDDATARARVDAPGGARVEAKGLSLTIHYREHPEVDGAVKAYAEAEAARTGLVARPARMSVELHPPIATDKGSVLDVLADGLAAVVFVGDDVGDLAAFDALDRMARAGVVTAKIAVRSPEVASALLASADVVVDGPLDVVALLASLVPRVG